MDKETALNLVKDILPEARFRHTVRVTDTALTLAERYGADSRQAGIAAALHDIAKYFEEEKLIRLIRGDASLDDHWLDYHPNIWHGPAGAAHIKNEYGVDDQDVLNAVVYHTTCREGMSLLERIVFLADYIEPGRDFEGVKEVRELSESSLDAAVRQALVNTICFLAKKKREIYPGTLAAYNEFVKNA